MAPEAYVDNCTGVTIVNEDRIARVFENPLTLGAVHEEGLEPPHLAVPEPKSGSRLSTCFQMSGNARLRKGSRHLATFPSALDDW